MDESAVRDALAEVVDPEAGINIVDLGLVHGVGVGAAWLADALVLALSVVTMASSAIRARTA